jgi:hypothetical protein
LWELGQGAEAIIHPPPSPLIFSSFPNRIDSLRHRRKPAVSLFLLPIKSKADTNSYEHIIVSGVGSFLMNKIKIKM